MLSLSTKGTISSFDHWTRSEFCNITISTYMKTIKLVDNLLSDNTSFLKNEFKLEVKEINKKV